VVGGGAVALWACGLCLRGSGSALFRLSFYLSPFVRYGGYVLHVITHT
jgi:hypothetical protein